MSSHKRARIPVGVVGASGYTGRELLGLLARHPDVSVLFATSRSEAGGASPVPGLALTGPEEAPLDEARLVFLCVPHGEGRPWVERLRRAVSASTRVVDLTADHRPGSNAGDGAVYGLTELAAGALAGAALVANPGCYPTGVLLALLPLCRAGMLDRGRPVVIHAASGVTGAGRSPRADLLFAEVHGDFRSYALGNDHRHLREMRALLPGLQVLFTPHLLPVPRGILETMAVPLVPGADAATLREVWRTSYGDGGAVRIRDGAPSLSDVTGTDLLLLSAHDNTGLDPSVVTVVAALDNLGKGAAGQAVQNMNHMLGLEPGRGVRW